MRERWLSKRAVALHVVALVFVPGCAVAAWWQVTRAEDGNQLSYLYSVMWPAFGILAICFWWMLIHTDYDNVGLKGLRRQQQLESAAESAATPADGPHATTLTAPAHAAPADGAGTIERLGADPDEDPELAAYNARLARLSEEGPKTWRRPERIVARRAQ